MCFPFLHDGELTWAESLCIHAARYKQTSFWTIGHASSLNYMVLALCVNMGRVAKRNDPWAIVQVAEEQADARQRCYPVFRYPKAIVHVPQTQQTTVHRRKRLRKGTSPYLFTGRDDHAAKCRG